MTPPTPFPPSLTSLPPLLSPSLVEPLIGRSLGRDSEVPPKPLVVVVDGPTRDRRPRPLASAPIQPVSPRLLNTRSGVNDSLVLHSLRQQRADADGATDRPLRRRRAQAPAARRGRLRAVGASQEGSLKQVLRY